MKKLLLITLLAFGGLSLLFATGMVPPPIMVSLPGATATRNGALAYDSTNDMIHGAQASADAMVPQFTVTPANNDPVCWVVSGNNYKLGNTGCSGGGSSLVQQTTTNITAAQFKALLGTPVTLVAAASGVYNEVLGVVIEFNPVTTQYAAGSNLVVKLNGAYFSNTSISSAGNINGLTAKSQIVWSSASGNWINNAINTAVTLTVDSADFTTGDGTFIVHTNYIAHTGL